MRTNQPCTRKLYRRGTKGFLTDFKNGGFGSTYLTFNIEQTCNDLGFNIRRLVSISRRGKLYRNRFQFIFFNVPHKTNFSHLINEMKNGN